MNAFKETCLRLRKKDYSLLDIARATGRSKTSIYFHIKKFPLSAAKRRRVREANIAHLTRVAAARKGKSLRSFLEFSEWNNETVCLVSHLLFDGEIKSHACVYNNRSAALIRTVKYCMHTIYTFEPKLLHNRNTGVYRISYFNVALSLHIKKRAEELVRDISRFSLDLKRVFLRSFFDDEGCIDYKPSRHTRRIRGYQKNRNVLFLIHELLSDFGIRAVMVKPNEIVITGRENLVLFERSIGFSPGVKINGKRSNSIWKKHFEKRRLLQMAIASYQK